jgi:predicted nuclease of restriction endonuclease-like (RecB) superfamily
MLVLNRNKEIDSEKTKSMLVIASESNATKKKIEKKPLLISFLSVLEEKNLTKAVESANEAKAVKSETVTDS